MMYEFEEFTFSRARGLSRGGEDVPIEPKASEILEYLLSNPGRIVTKDELVNHLWGGRAITDAALSTQMRNVRRALGDDRSQQRFVRTLPKRGFKFVAGVLAAKEDDSVQALAAQRPAAAPPALWRRAPRRHLAVVASLFLITVAGVAAIFYWGGHETPAAAGSPRMSIAVLPFENLSADSELSYLVDAFTEDLITDLSRIQDAFVISRSTTFAYRGKDTDAPAVAAELGIRYVLEGSLRVDGDMVRVNAQLIDGEANNQPSCSRHMALRSAASS